MRIRSGVLLLSLALSGGAFAAPEDPVKFVGLLEQMRGHYDVVLFNYRAGKQVLALKHASHPANELYDAVKADLTPELQTRFRKGYQAINAVLAAKKPVSTLQAALNSFSADVDAAVATVPAATLKDPKYGARVISGILGNTKTEYSGGVSGGQVVNPAEYQDAQFYLARASGWLAKYRAQFPADQGGQAAAALVQARTLHLARADPKTFNAHTASISMIAVVSKRVNPSSALVPLTKRFERTTGKTASEFLYALKPISIASMARATGIPTPQPRVLPRVFSPRKRSRMTACLK